MVFGPLDDAYRVVTELNRKDSLVPTGRTSRQGPVRGLDDRAGATIARELLLSPKTVRNYISNIFRKLQVADRAQAIVIGREAGLNKPST